MSDLLVLVRLKAAQLAECLQTTSWQSMELSSQTLRVEITPGPSQTTVMTVENLEVPPRAAIRDDALARTQALGMVAK